MEYHIHVVTIFKIYGRLFAISQSETSSSSLFNMTSADECLSINTLVSSANKIEKTLNC